MTSLLAVVLIAFSTALLMLRLLLAERFHNLALDRPNERSLHDRVVPRTGGLAILLGTWVAFWETPLNSSTALLWGLALCLAGVSFLDDRRGLPISLRLGAQVATALGGTLVAAHDLSLFWIAASAIAIVWMTNLYNFMDGSDGLAGGMGFSGFSAYAIAFELHGDHAPAALCASLAAGCVGFLTHNYPPARIFMGDVGSTVLGFSSAVLGLYGISLSVWPLWFPALVFLPFGMDATLTLLKRGLRREKVWCAHREHYYQRLIRSGWSHAATAKVAYAIMLATGASALVTLAVGPVLGWGVFGVWCVGMAMLMRLADGRWARSAAGRKLRDPRDTGSPSGHSKDSERSSRS